MITILRRLLQSFSFRLLFITMLVFFSTMILMRVALYRATIREAEEEIKRTVNEQYLQIDQGIQKKGFRHGMTLMASVMHFDIENLFALSYVDKKGQLREGNLTAWPEVTAKEGEWFTFRVASLPGEINLTDDTDALANSFQSTHTDDVLETRTFLARIHYYPSGGRLLIGYDMRHANQLRAMLFNVVVENTIMSLLASIFCSVLLSYWISSRLRLINRTCNTVMAGNLEERVPTSGGRDEFDQLASNFNAMLSWITQLIHSIKDTTNALAHDMRTPLSRHRIYLTRLISQPDFPEKHKPALQKAVDEVDTIVGLYDAILSISRAESRAAVASFRSFNLHELLVNVTEIYELLAEQRGITITLTCPDSLTLNGEQQLVAQAVANLVDNAVKYAPTNSTITISATAENTLITIDITDSGSGIPEEEREKAKERFYRLDKSRSTPGTGLGLSLVAAVMRLHGGDFTLSDGEPGLKATLRFVR
jgi:signal transduction histidine kinase